MALSDLLRAAAWGCLPGESDPVVTVCAQCYIKVDSIVMSPSADLRSRKQATEICTAQSKAKEESESLKLYSIALQLDQLLL